MAAGGGLPIDRPFTATLHPLTAAYLAVVERRAYAERIAEVERQAAKLVGGSRALIHPLGDPRLDLGTTITIPLFGGAGSLDVSAPAAHRWLDGAFETLEQFALLVAGPINDARLLALSTGLERVGSMLGDAGDPDTVVASFLDSGLQLTGARFGVVLLRQGNVLRVVGARSSGRFALDDTIAVDDERPLAAVARTGVANFQPDLASVRNFLAADDAPLDDAPEQAWAALPIVSGRQVLGTVGLRFDGRQAFDAPQREFLLAVGERLGGALDRARSFQQERAARMAAEDAAGRVQRMRDFAAELSRAETRRAVANVLLRAVMASSGASIGLVATYRSGGRRIELLASDPPGHELYLPPEDVRRAIDSGLQRGESLELRTVAEVERTLETDIVATEFGAASLGFYPITFRRRQVGVVLLGWHDVGRFDAFDREALKTLVVMAGPVLQRAARFESEHEISNTLQRSLLTIPRFEMPQMRWSTHYRTGSSGLAGGDWYDVVPVDEHRVAYAIGDIVGRGIDAAAAMGQLRSASRALSLRGSAPGSILEHLDQFASATGAGLFSTVALAIVDARTGTMDYAAAGHPLPLMRRTNGTTAALEDGRSSLLGRGGSRPTATLRLRRGDTVVLYTDGLIERRGESISEGVDRALAVLADEARSGDRRKLSYRLVDRLLLDGAVADDVAVLTFTYLGGR